MLYNVYLPQDDLPANSLLFFHGRDDDDQSHGGFNSAVIDGDSMLVTFYTAKGNAVVTIELHMCMVYIIWFYIF